MDQFFCEHPGHEGDRRIRHVGHQVLVTVDFMRADNGERFARIGANGAPGGVRCCIGCASGWMAALRGRRLALPFNDASELPEQGAMV